MENENFHLARRWFEEVWNERRTETIDELLTDESVSHSESGPLRGKQVFIERTYSVFVSAFPDLRMTVEGIVADGDDVVVRWFVTATHTGDGLGFPATGRKVSFRGMTWIRFCAGKMIEGWDCWNQEKLMQSLREPSNSPRSATQ
jgi:steroid delta-isomerase-like uncharacterized protein